MFETSCCFIGPSVCEKSRKPFSLSAAPRCKATWDTHGCHERGGCLRRRERGARRQPSPPSLPPPLIAAARRHHPRSTTPCSSPPATPASPTAEQRALKDASRGGVELRCPRATCRLYAFEGFIPRCATAPTPLLSPHSHRVRACWQVFKRYWSRNGAASSGGPCACLG